jgi:hypothetical protein
MKAHLRLTNAEVTFDLRPPLASGLLIEIRSDLTVHMRDYRA